MAPCPYGASPSERCTAAIGRDNVHVNHQNSELTFPMVDAALARGTAPEIILWQLYQCLPLTRDILSAAMPNTQLICGALANASCSERVTFKAIGTGRLPFPKLAKRSADALRAAVHTRCGIRREERGNPARHPQTGLPQLRLRLRLLQRERSNETSMCGSSFLPKLRGLTPTAQSLIAQMLPRAIVAGGGAPPTWSVAMIPASSPGSLCEQAVRFSDVDVLVSVHGAHLVLAATLRPGAVLVEVTPWANFGVGHFAALVHNTGIARVQICATRPAALAPSGAQQQGGASSSSSSKSAARVPPAWLGWQPSAEEAACARSQTCRVEYLGCYGSDLPVDLHSVGESPACTARCRCVKASLEEVAKRALSGRFTA